MAMAVAAGAHAAAFLPPREVFLSKSCGRGLAGGPASICISRNFLRHNPRLYSSSRLRITLCEAAGRDFDSRAARLAEEARRKAGEAARAFTGKADEVFNDVKRKAAEFQENNDVKGKVNRAARTANIKLEELAYDLKKSFGKWDREYGITDKVQRAKDFATEQVQNVDRQLGVRQKARNATTDFRLKLPTYRRQLSNFLETPLGKSVVTLFFLWFLVSGWAFRIFFFSLWFLPFAGPLLIGTLSKAAVVEGACPNCGARYVGGRNQVVMCQRCRGVVWQPRQDFSKKDNTDPSIIDIDIDKD